VKGCLILIGLLSLGLIGCGEGGVKPEESMDSTFAKAKKDNPGAKAPPGKSGKIKADEANMPKADNAGN
jgi:hypothetical protein